MEQTAKPAPGNEALRRFDAVIRQPGVMERFGRITEHGASPEDLEWLDRQIRETGFKFRAAVAAYAALEEDY